MKLDTTYYAIKGVFSDLLGKGIYEGRAAAELDLDRLLRTAEMQLRSVEMSGDSVIIDAKDAEYQQLKAAKVVEVCVYETSPVIHVHDISNEPAYSAPALDHEVPNETTIAAIKEAEEIVKKKRTRKKKEAQE